VVYSARETGRKWKRREKIAVERTVHFSIASISPGVLAKGRKWHTDYWGDPPEGRGGRGGGVQGLGRKEKGKKHQSFAALTQMLTKKCLMTGYPTELSARK